MYCIDFFRKWKKEGNFCGLDKGQVSRLNAYMDIVELLVKQKIPEDQIFENFSVGAATPLIAAKDQARTEGLNFVTARLKAGKKVQAGDIQTTLKSCKFTTSPPVSKAVQQKEPEKPKERKAEKPADFPDHVPPAEVTVPLKADPAKPPQPSLLAQQAAREPPFKNGNEIAQGLMYQPPAPAPESVKVDMKAKREEAAGRLLNLLPNSTSVMVSDILREHPGWGLADIFYFGVEALHEKKGRV